ncbi:Glutamate synthase [NADPH] large chain [Halioglobus japonicus]|nr:Glutamate synthase [NADPH] large chain [Halioglobus japonicus]
MIVRELFVGVAIVTCALVVALAQGWPASLWLFVLILPLIMLGTYDMLQRKHAILKLYPVIGHLRYLFESVRPEIQQYFVESDTNGAPISREFRSLVYQRAKGARDTRPFGTLFEVYRDGYEWINHSLAPKAIDQIDSTVCFGGPQCSQPYDASLLNISAMSFGALSQNAVMALNKGAKAGGFAHNTGEGGISPHHLKFGGDLIWQIGTGYFGCRTDSGEFDEALFAKNARGNTVKMIEIKLSQGAKPGHGGILPAIKLTQEIADIRHVPMGQDVVSPGAHTAFTTPLELLQFVARLRSLSAGKPVGFKLCVGKKCEFLAICKAMLETGITPDFITVDGGEGGTGAAPIELTNSAGTPLRDGLSFVHNALVGIGVRDQIRIVASGKALTAFHMLRLMALGADTINSARAMMFALGCIQSRHCNEDTCPTGIATQNAKRYQALDVEDKSTRVATYHASMIKHLRELIAVAGLNGLKDIGPSLINRRIGSSDTTDYSEIYDTLGAGCLLSEQRIPPPWQKDWHQAHSSAW